MDLSLCCLRVGVSNYQRIPDGPATLLMMERGFQIIEGSPNVLLLLLGSILSGDLSIFLQN